MARDESPIKKIERFKQSIESAKADKVRTETKLAAVDEQLQEDFEADSVDAAQKVLKGLQADEARLAKEVADGLEALEQRYEW